MKSVLLRAIDVDPLDPPNSGIELFRSIRKMTMSISKTAIRRKCVTTLEPLPR
jgi:hypothetical protein